MSPYVTPFLCIFLKLEDFWCDVETDKKATFVFLSVLLVNTIYRINKKIQCLLQQLQHRYSNQEDMYDINLVLRSRLLKLSQTMLSADVYSFLQTSVVTHHLVNINIFGGL